jgi:hypothetical protein
MGDHWILVVALGPYFAVVWMTIAAVALEYLGLAGPLRRWLRKRFGVED